MNTVTVQGVSKFGLVNNKPALERLERPPECGEVRQASATPRHILTVTDTGYSRHLFC